MSTSRSKISLTLKMFLVGFLMILLLIPLMLIGSLIPERARYQRDAAAEVQASWGSAQIVGAVVLVVPYKFYVKEYETRKGKQILKKITEMRSLAYFLPEKLTIAGRIDPEIRYRGIFPVLLYKTDLQIQGEMKPDFSAWKANIEEKDILWKEAYFLLGISDLKGIQQTPEISLRKEKIPFLPPEDASKLFPSSLQSKALSIQVLNPGEGIPFSMDLKLAGSETLRFLPLGKTTEVKLQSSWTSPSFVGTLPTERTLSDTRGFSALWKSFYLNRGYPQSWLYTQLDQIRPYLNPTSEWELRNHGFGVNLIFPVDIYQQTTRAVKYGILFVALTFTVFFLFEVLSKLSIHPVQYLLVGMALSLFYLLLLSLSEHLSFFESYLIAATSNVALITLYSTYILPRKSRALLIFGLLGGLYGYLYVLLQSEDRSLLLGSIGLFAILAVIMFITRKVNWYGIGREPSPPAPLPSAEENPAIS